MLFVLATAGVATSEAIHVTVAAAGLAALFAAAPAAFTVVRIAEDEALRIVPAKKNPW